VTQSTAQVDGVVPGLRSPEVVVAGRRNELAGPLQNRSTGIAHADEGKARVDLDGIVPEGATVVVDASASRNVVEHEDLDCSLVSRLQGSWRDRLQQRKQAQAQSVQPS
jgi:hypothetical protein